MKDLIVSVLLLQSLVPQAWATLSGQTSHKVYLVTGDDSESGSTTTCFPYSIKPENSENIYVKYVLNITEAESNVVTWDSHPDKKTFGDCASQAVASNAAMFYFDEDTCETSSDGYERQEKSCGSVSAKVVYMLKGYEPDGCVTDAGFIANGEELETTVPCGVSGKYICQDSELTIKRLMPYGSFSSHMENIDYLLSASGCFFSATGGSEEGVYEIQKSFCGRFGLVPCSPGNGVTDGTFLEEMKAYLAHTVGIQTFSDEVMVSLFYNSTTKKLYWDETTESTIQPFSEVEDCYAFNATKPYDLSSNKCSTSRVRNACCMLKA